MRRDSFERFYLEKVALGEGCGCAEHVTRIRELDRFAKGSQAPHGLFTARPSAWPARAFAWLRARLLSSPR